MKAAFSCLYTSLNGIKHCEPARSRATFPVFNFFIIRCWFDLDLNLIGSIKRSEFNFFRDSNLRS